MDSSDQANAFFFSANPALDAIRLKHDDFVQKRGWDKFHAPRNIVLALVGEVGEVAEIFQWKGEVEEGLPDWSAKEKDDLEQELADVLIYLTRLAHKCRIDLPKAVEKKLQINEAKYPVDLVYGSSKKYTEYKETAKPDVNSSDCGKIVIDANSSTAAL